MPNKPVLKPAAQVALDAMIAVGRDKKYTGFESVIGQFSKDVMEIVNSSPSALAVTPPTQETPTSGEGSVPELPEQG